jgi:hypothetical protein
MSDDDKRAEATKRAAALKTLKKRVSNAQDEIFDAMSAYTNDTNDELAVELHLLLVNEHYEINTLSIKRPELIYSDDDED